MVPKPINSIWMRPVIFHSQRNGNTISEPRDDMEFESHEDAYSFYKEHAMSAGFGAAKFYGMKRMRRQVLNAPIKSPSPFEKQMSLVYTDEIFRKFQVEVLGAAACHLKKESQDKTTTMCTVKDIEDNQKHQ
ncbi:hypothetical protein NC651_000246 [Populus alba x Populus x berolinensis]|nr:hypothetical protein NC651_000246 [Populus alba x Populus x berolinensis]